MLDVALACRELSHLSRVDVEADDPVAHFGIAEGKREADVAEAEDADHGLPVFQTADQLRVSHRARQIA